MAHAERVLLTGEQIVYRARLHWIIFAPGALSILVASLVAAYGAPLAETVSHYSYLAIGAALGGAGLFSLLRASVRRMNTELVVSTQRIIYKPGWGARAASAVNLDEAENLKVSQGMLGRLFDFGTLTVRGGGAAVGPVANVAAPRNFHLASTPIQARPPSAESTSREIYEPGDEKRR